MRVLVRRREYLASTLTPNLLAEQRNLVSSLNLISRLEHTKHHRPSSFRHRPRRLTAFTPERPPADCLACSRRGSTAEPPAVAPAAVETLGNRGIAFTAPCQRRRVSTRDGTAAAGVDWRPGRSAASAPRSSTLSIHPPSPYRTSYSTHTTMYVRIAVQSIVLLCRY